MFGKSLFLTFYMLVSLSTAVATQGSCLSNLSDLPLFMLTNPTVVGGVNFNYFTDTRYGSLEYKNAVFLSEPLEKENVFVVVLSVENKLYLMRRRDGRYVRLNAWLLSGDINVSSFGVTERGYISVSDFEGTSYTVDFEFMKSLLGRGSEQTFQEWLFGRQMPDSGLLIENSDSVAGLQRLNTEAILNILE